MVAPLFFYQLVFFGFCRNLHLRRFGVCALPVPDDAQGGRAMLAVSCQGAHVP
jgi:hypothetical protein